MENLFKANLSQSQVDTQQALKQNIDFSARIVRDLVNTFNVTTEQKRWAEAQHETVVYEPRQHGRYGWGFRFTATTDGVSFEDERGMWLTTIAKVLSVDVSDRYEQKDADLAKLREAVKGIGSIRYNPDSACGDHYSLKLSLSQNDADLNVKVKLIIGILMSHRVTTKL